MQITEWTLKRLQKMFQILPNWRNFAKSGHTARDSLFTFTSFFRQSWPIMRYFDSNDSFGANSIKYYYYKWTLKNGSLDKVILKFGILFHWVLKCMINNGLINWEKCILRFIWNSLYNFYLKYIRRSKFSSSSPLVYNLFFASS